jgi:hypothetical protein
VDAAREAGAEVREGFAITGLRLVRWPGHGHSRSRPHRHRSRRTSTDRGRRRRAQFVGRQVGRGH